CEQTTESECTGFWRGLFTRCNDPGICTDGIGACCGRFGSCFVTTKKACEERTDGTYKGDGVGCGSGTCPGVVSCCFFDGLRPTGCTEELSEGECESLGGVPHAGVLCSSDPCTPDPDPGQACCVGETCIGVENSGECAGLGGVFLGPATCDEVACSVG